MKLFHHIFIVVSTIVIAFSLVVIATRENLTDTIPYVFNLLTWVCWAGVIAVQIFNRTHRSTEIEEETNNSCSFTVPSTVEYVERLPENNTEPLDEETAEIHRNEGFTSHHIVQLNFANRNSISVLIDPASGLIRARGMDYTSIEINIGSPLIGPTTTSLYMVEDGAYRDPIALLSGGGIAEELFFPEDNLPTVRRLRQ